MAQVATIQKRTFEQPDEIRAVGTGSWQIVNAANVGLIRATLPPGWQWSIDVKPLVHTETCQAHHLIYVLSGRIHVEMGPGSEEEFGPTDVGLIPPGHNAWTVGDEPVVYLDITGSAVWEKPN